MRAPNKEGRMETTYVVQGFEAGKKGALIALPAVACKTEEQALGRAERLRHRCAGVVAFAQSADAEIGEYADPVVLVTYGDVPEMV
jgi:hypothetical protein